LCFLGCFLCSLLSHACVLSVDLQLTELSVNSGLLNLLGQLNWGLSCLNSWLGEDVLCCVLLFSLGRLQLFSSRVSNITLLWLVLSSWEEDQFALIGFKSLHVELKSFLRGVLSSVVNSDSNSSGKLSADFGLRYFLKCETSSIS